MIEILRNIENIDFMVLYTGKVCVDEIARIRRVARMDCLKTPGFLQDIEQYKKTLRFMAWKNGLGPRPERKSNSVKVIKLRHNRITKKKSAQTTAAKNKKADETSTLYQVQRTPLVDPLPRITQASQDFLNSSSLIDEAEDDCDDEITTCPPDNTYATTRHALNRPKSTPNTLQHNNTNDLTRSKRIDWFGMLERKWEE